MHCTRANAQSIERESARASAVLPTPGIVLDEDVALGEHRHGDVLEHLVLDLDGPADVLSDAAGDRYGGVDLRLCEPLRDGLLQGFHSASNLYVV